MNESFLGPNRWLIKLFYPFFVVLLIVRGIAHFADDPGVGWHLLNGKMILSSFSIPYFDSFLSIQRPWISDQWLADLIFAFFFELFDWTGLYILCFSLFFASFYLSSSLQPFKVSSLSLFISLFCVFQLMSIHAVVRPVLWSFLFFIIQYQYLLYLLKERKVQFKTYLYCFIFYAGWSNLHPSFLLGLVAIFIAALSETLFRFLKTENVEDRSLTSDLLLLGVCGAVGSVCNPNFYHLHKSIYELGSSEFFMSLNKEWLPLSIASIEGKILMIISFCILFSHYFLMKEEERRCALKQPATLFSFLLCFAFFFQCLTSVRFVPYFALIIFNPLLRSIDTIINFLCSLFRPIYHRSAPFFFSLTALLLSYFLIIAINGFWKTNFNLAPSQSVYPYEILSILKEKSVTSNSPLIVYNHPDFGGFLTFFGEGKIIPVLDDRNGLLREEPYKEFLDAKTTSSLKSIAQKYHAQYILTSQKRAPIKDDESLRLISTESGSLLFEVE